jgi:putative ABC transport system substrate-binding protein
LAFRLDRRFPPNWLGAWRAGAILASRLCLCVLAWASNGTDDESPRSIAVIYPDIGEPYRSAFATIVRGIEDRAPGKTTSLAIAQDANSSAVIDELRHRNVRTVIALGRTGLKVAHGLDRQLRVIAGGVLSVPEAEAQGMMIQSLAPDPALMFAKLKAFVPNARRVVVVYDPRQNEWLIRLARESAKAQGLELLALEADELKSALRRYQDVMGALNPRRDVLWLPQDSTTVDESAVLPWLLRESWNQGLVVFSSNVAHVRRGALFSLYPDNTELGRHLGSTAMASLAPGALPPVHGLYALRQVLTAVNSRTAEHLGVDLRSAAQRIHLVLPEQ